VTFGWVLDGTLRWFYFYRGDAIEVSDARPNEILHLRKYAFRGLIELDVHTKLRKHHYASLSKSVIAVCM
jgi:hypothetical protein